MRDRPLPLRTQWTGLPRDPLHPAWHYLSYAIVPFVLVSLGVGLAAKSSTKKPVPIVAPVQRSDDFDKRYGEPMPPAVLRVRTIPIVPVAQDPPPPPPKVETAVYEEPAPRRIRNRGGDVCKRHGLRKVMTGKYRWRCKR